jgi:hypothetical protein
MANNRILISLVIVELAAADHAPPPPSIWWNSARCVRSIASFRNTRSMEKYLAGRKPSCASLYSMRDDTAVVCVRSRFFSASDSFQW